MGEMSIINKEGDTKIIWDPEKEEEVKNARDTFERLTGEGYLAFYVRKKGEKGEKMKEFDPDAEKMILVPLVRGG